MEKNKPAPVVPEIPALPETGFIRLYQVLQFIPIGKTRWYKAWIPGKNHNEVSFKCNDINLF